MASERERVIDASMCHTAINGIVAMYGDPPRDLTMARRLAEWRRELARFAPPAPLPARLAGDATGGTR